MKLFLLSLITNLYFELPVINENIKIDGMLDEEGWKKAIVFSDFKVFEPDYLAKPSYRTEVLLLQTEDALLVAFRGNCGAKIKKPVTRRDDEEGDFIGIYLDTFGDGQTAYFFGINFAGVQVDKVLTGGGKYANESWDGVWFSSILISDTIFTAEFKIPFRSLQFKKDFNVFSFEARRYISEYNQRVFLGVYSRERGLEISRFPVKIKVDFKRNPSKIDLLPVLLFERNQEKLEIRAGLDAKVSFKENFSVNMTVNPDFAQVEADPFRVNTGKYENFLDERRPFFTDDVGAFSFRTNPSGYHFNYAIIPFYTRRIGKGLLGLDCVPILLGIKGSYKSKGSQTSFLSALTGEKIILFEGDTIHEPLSLYNAFSFKKYFLSSSAVNFLYAGKMEENNIFKNHTYGLEFHLLEGASELAGGYAGSFYEDQRGDALALGLLKKTEKMNFLFSFVDIDENFNVSEVGFTPWTGIKKLVAGAGPNFYFKNGKMQSLSIFGGYTNVNEVSDSGNPEYAFFSNFDIEFRRGGGFSIYLSRGKSYENNYFERSEVKISGWLPGNMMFRGFSELSYSHDYNYLRGYVGDMFSHFIGVGTNSNSRLSFRLRFGGMLELNPDGKIEGYTVNLQPRISFAVTKDMTINLTSQVVFNALEGEMLFSAYSFVYMYNFNPKSWVYFVVSRAHDRGSGIINQYGLFKIRYLLMI
ncbi:MAG: DUF5916 domain-containing protein [candidate division WOR-3 bacterium]